MCLRCIVEGSDSPNHGHSQYYINSLCNIFAYLAKYDIPLVCSILKQKLKGLIYENLQNVAEGGIGPSLTAI